ncbi:hypothetical protein HMPREF0995_05873 [Lachnospiraceae bacterium 7_1_58FAA]|nr:hypothetical protein HMPREF0995_05873 [Lachnospiraceae bacterium 7_1_58FAA]
MEKTELTVSMEPERLDALRYFLAAKNKRTPQKELQRALEELYEAYVPAETRGLPGRPVPAGPGQASAAGGIQGYTDAEGGSDRWRPLN